MTSRTRRRLLLALAGVLFAAYALPLFAPPPPLPPAAPTPDAGFVARVFPGVPERWIVLRLVALVGAVVVAGAAVRGSPMLHWPARAAGLPLLPRGALLGALALASAHAASALVADGFSRPAQSVYFALFAAPALLLHVAERARRARPMELSSPEAPWQGWATLLVALLWIATRVPDLVSPVRAADPVDTWLSHEWIERAAFDGRNLLFEGFLPGLTGIYMFLQGVSILGPGGLAPSFAWLQMVHMFWCVVAGLGVAALVARLVSPGAAPVATAAFLFAPFVLLQPLVPAPYIFGPLYTAGLALLVVAVQARRSAAALAALGALAGVAATSHPPLAPVAGLALAGGLWSASRSPRLPGAAFAIPLLSLFAAALPALPDLETLAQMRDEFTRGRGEWAGLEAVLLGQRDPYAIPAIWQAGRPGVFDVALGSLLSPFAIPRTPLRAWGDTLFDPTAAALSALGILLALRAARREAAARAVLLVLLVGMVPAFASSYDRPSHTRLFVAQVPLAVLAAAGFEAIRRATVSKSGLAPRLATALAVAAIAVGGTLLFDVVNPRILAASSLSLTARAIGDRLPEGGAALLVFPGPDDLSWLHEERILRATAPGPVRIVPYEGPPSLASRAAPGTAAAEWIFFSPGLDAHFGVTRKVCARWPRAALYELRDAAGLSRTYLARPAGPGSPPSLPATQVRRVGCGPLATPPA